MDSRRSSTNRKSDSRADDSQKLSSASSSIGSTSPHNCPACGAFVHRRAANYCATCGRPFTDAFDYLPADALRASYHTQYRTPAELKQSSEKAIVSPAALDGRVHAKRIMTVVKSAQHARNFNNASQLALAFATYALVPYLGILFCPGAIITGCYGLLRVHRAPHLNGRRAAVQGIVAGILILCAQLFLWWILYKVPEWATP